MRNWAIGMTFFMRISVIVFSIIFMIFEEKIECVKSDLKNKAVPVVALTSKLYLIDDDSRLASAFGDPRNTPFYYYLGKYFQPSSVLEIMPGAGIYSSALVRGHKDIKSYYGWHIDTSGEYYNPRLFFRNIKTVSRKIDVRLKRDQNNIEVALGYDYDLIILSYGLEKGIGLDLLEVAWSKMKDSSAMVINQVDNSNKSLSETFCGRIGRSPTYISTRYGIHMIEK